MGNQVQDKAVSQGLFLATLKSAFDLYSGDFHDLLLHMLELCSSEVLEEENKKLQHALLSFF